MVLYNRYRTVYRYSEHTTDAKLVLHLIAWFKDKIKVI